MHYVFICIVYTSGLDYLTSANFLDKLDTGVLVCHLARRIQTIAKDVVASRRAILGDDAVDAMDYGGFRTTKLTNGSPDAVKQAQQYLQALLRSANNHANLLAAAKVSSVFFLHLFLFCMMAIFFLKKT